MEAPAVGFAKLDTLHKTKPRQAEWCTFTMLPIPKALLDQPSSAISVTHRAVTPPSGLKRLSRAGLGGLLSQHSGD